MKLKPGTALEWAGAHGQRPRLQAIVGKHAVQPGHIPLEAWIFDGTTEWIVHPRGHTEDTGYKVLTGDEADRVHAAYVAAQLLGNIKTHL